MELELQLLGSLLGQWDGTHTQIPKGKKITAAKPHSLSRTPLNRGCVKTV
ncbi:hypothetical protein PATSB16_28250 [Pandoraea thiooxydans]|nr:hypothetical protein PATSB16_28250 [Pandoraea thiooxydans]